MLDRIALNGLPRSSRILDLCCGTGHLASRLSRRGFRVTGLDGSAEMIRFARENAPNAHFIVGDARTRRFRCCFDAAISTGDSMNHILDINDLALVFANVHRALCPGGLFGFDMNMLEAYATEWRKSSTIVEGDNLVYVRGKYDRTRKLGTTQITAFRLNGEWTRLDVQIHQRCYARAQIVAALRKAGFGDITMRSARSLGMRGRLSVGRTFVVTRKSAI